MITQDTITPITLIPISATPTQLRRIRRTVATSPPLLPWINSLNSNWRPSSSPTAIPAFARTPPTPHQAYQKAVKHPFEWTGPHLSFEVELIVFHIARSAITVIVAQQSETVSDYQQRRSHVGGDGCPERCVAGEGEDHKYCLHRQRKGDVLANDVERSP